MGILPGTTQVQATQTCRGLDHAGRLGRPRVASARALIFRNNQFGELVDGLVLGIGEKERLVGFHLGRCRFAVGILAGKGPAAEARELSECGNLGKHRQHLATTG